MWTLPDVIKVIKVYPHYVKQYDKSISVWNWIIFWKNILLLSLGQIFYMRPRTYTPLSCNPGILLTICVLCRCCRKVSPIRRSHDIYITCEHKSIIMNSKLTQKCNQYIYIIGYRRYVNKSWYLHNRLTFQNCHAITIAGQETCNHDFSTIGECAIRIRAIIAY